ncbi:MAG TPA: secretin N-terminal domain-containing protein [Pirellulales bacterium]|nr:secretin N-terminal domain-containing protein [Pirellulales bacterium]
MSFPGMMPGMPPFGQEKKDEEKKPDGEKKDDEAPKKVDDGPWRPEPVKRSPWPRWPANPAELEVRPDENGQVSFRFRGQPWPSVLEWLADISRMTLQWEATPPGYLELAPRGKYTVDQVRDLITSVLLSKGFALMRKGDVLIVADAKNLDPGLAPRVSIAELRERGDHELVRVLFDLDWLLAEAAAEELKPMLGPYGKITPLKTANRLDVLGAAGNLRRVHEMLVEEQSTSVQTRLVREFRLRYTRAADVLEKLQSLLGVGAQANSAQALMTQMMAQGGGDRDRRDRFRRDRDRDRGDENRSGQPGMMPQAPEPTPEFYLAVNARTNSILVNAPPDKMAKIEQAIEVIDVPQARDGSILDGLPRVQAYRLAAIDPETLVKVLNESGDLDASTRLEIDAANGALIAYAPLADQMLIRSLIDVLDGSSRRFEVVQLRTLSAEFVAGSIQSLMVGPEPQDNSRRRSSSDASQAEGDRFQVEADIEHNRLLLRANDAELAEIRSLLMKLGEIPAPGAKASTMRMIPAAPGQEIDRLLEQIEHLWPSLGPNPLEVEPESRPSPLAPESEPQIDESPDGASAEEPAADEPQASRADGPTTRPVAPAKARSRFRFAQQSQPAENEPEPPAAAAPVEATTDNEPEEKPRASAAEPEREDQPGESLLRPGRELPRAAHAPVRIAVGPYGLVISSSDAQALDRLEELIGNFMPARLSYKVFKIKNTYARDLALLLEDIYKNEEQETGADPFGGSRRYGSRSRTSEPPRSSLSRRRPLAFVPDAVTNTILVQGADANQLAEIESLIKLYDGDDVPDSKSVRQTELVSLRYAKAVDVAEVVKDVYRDLLSPNDKALQRNVGQPQQQQQREGGFRSPSFSYLSDDAEATQNIPRFKGMLSIGIDERANGLAISAPQILLADVLEMVDRLDQAAKPTRAVVRIMKLRQPGSAAHIERALGPAKPAAGAPNAESAAASPSTSNAPSSNPAAPRGFGRRGEGAAN